MADFKQINREPLYRIWDLEPGTLFVLVEYTGDADNLDDTDQLYMRTACAVQPVVPVTGPNAAVPWGNEIDDWLVRVVHSVVEVG